MEPTDQPIDLLSKPHSASNEYAGFLTRFLAYFIDAILLTFVLGIVFTVFILISGVGFSVLENSDDLGSQMAFMAIYVVFLVVVFATGWLYYALMESGKNQGTFGKMALNIKVTDENGGPISFGRASGRYFGKMLSGMIFYIGYIMIAFTEKQQGLHDMISGCLVVKK